MVVAVGLAVMGTFAVASAAAADEVILANDFESGSFVPWGPRGNTTVAITTESGHDSAHSLAVTNRTANWNGTQTSVTALFEEDVVYSISAWVKLPAGTAISTGVKFTVQGTPTAGGGDTFTQVNNPVTTDANTWVQIAGTYTRPAGLSSVVLYVEAADNTAPYLIDDIEITGPSSGPEIITVSSVDFEDGTIGNWTQSGGGAGLLSVGPGPDGGQVLTVNNRAADYEGIQSPTGILEPGKTYSLSMKARLAPGTVGSAGVRFVGRPGFTWIGPTSMNADGWTTVTGTWTTPTNASTGELQVYIGTGDLDPVAPYTYLVDDVLITTEGGGGPAGEVVIDTDFESGLDGWVPRDGGPGAPTVTISTVAHGGTGAALIANRVNQGAGLGHDVTTLLDAGVTYELTAWVRFGDGQPIDEIWLSMQSNNGSGDSFATLAQFANLSNTGYTEVTASFTMQPFQTAFLYFETRYQGGATGNTSDFLVDDILLRVPEPPVVEDLPGIMTTTTFPVGVAIDNRETVGSAATLLTRHFNQITAENHMKPEAWYDADRNFRPHDQAIALMDFARDNNIRVYGHVLVWHGQTPAWFFQDASGAPLSNSAADQQILRDRLRAHIVNVAQSLSTRYGPFGSATNPLKAFDVVNEVVSDSGEFADGLRRSEWYRILGESFIDLAFQYADEAFNDTYAVAGQNPVTLFINDYNTEQGGKQTRYKALVQRLLGRGVPVGGVGHQFHLSLATAVDTLDGALTAFDSLPVVQAVTELDVTTGTPVTQANLIEQGYFYRDAFRIFRAHASHVFSVTVWGLIDGRSWRASSGAPLIFDDGFQAKPAYYGAVDGALPARLRAANVFAGDVALNASATTSLEWKKLPLHPVEGAARFQLRWAPDHMTAFVAVADTTSSTTDKVAFVLNGQTYDVARDGTGDAPAVATQRSGGYDIVAHLPLTDATRGSTATLDVRVTNDETTTAWNNPGAVGTLSLVEALSYLEVNQARAVPVIDGAVDATWADAGLVTTGKQVSGTGGATADVRTLWKDQTLYVLAEVTDPIVDLTGSDPWTKDSVEIYVDGGNAKNGPYRFDDTQIRINADNGVSFGTGDETFQRNRLTSATSRTTTGYTVEAAISLLEYGGLGTFHGVDFQVNDASNGARTSIHNWAEEEGTGYQSTARWGVGRLIGPRPIVNIVAPSIEGSPVKGSVIRANPGQWSVPGVTFTYQWQRDGVNIKKETGRTYKVKNADVDHTLRVVVTAHATGYDPVSVASASVLARDPRCKPLAL